MLKIDAHAHTDYSRFPQSWENWHLDSYTHNYFQVPKGNPREVVSYAYKNGLDGILLTEKNNLSGAYKVVKICNELKSTGKISKDFIVVPGEEIATPLGEILAVGHEKGIGAYCPRYWKNFSIDDLYNLIDDIKKQGGACIIPHPFVDVKTGQKENITLNIGKKVLDRFLDKLNDDGKVVDGIEVWNSVTFSSCRIPIFVKNVRKQITDAIEACKRLHVSPTAGSDNYKAHQVGYAYTLFENYDVVDCLENRRTKIDLSKYTTPTLSESLLSFLYPDFFANLKSFL
jgi:hypothetical protein